MNAQNLMTNMQTVGVPNADVSWYHNEARPRDFKGDGDVHRARQILQAFYALARNSRDSRTTVQRQAA